MQRLKRLKKSIQGLKELKFLRTHMTTKLEDMRLKRKLQYHPKRTE